MRFPLRKMQKRRRQAVFAAALALSAVSAGCSTERLFGGSSAPSTAPQAANSPSIRDRVADLFSPAAASSASAEGGTVSPEELVCPTVGIRQGASTLTIPPAGEVGAMALRYQGSIGQMARECKVTGGVMHMKVGVQGRIILGPAGGPGKLDIPLRYAVVREGPEPVTITSKFYKVPVVVPDAQTNVSFTHVDDDVSFPMPGGMDIEAYVIYVGFDPAGEKQAPPKKQPPPRKPAATR